MARLHKPPYQRKADTVAADAPTLAASSATTMPANEIDSSLPADETDAPLSTSESEVLQPLVPLPTSMTTWQLCGDTVIGLAHRRKGLPCQDAVAFRNLPRPILALSDGAGSAAISERGAKTLVSGITRFLRTMEDAIAPWLDGEDDLSAQAQSTCWSERLRLHAHGLLADLAHAERRDVRDVRGTLQVAVIGECRIFWWKVGDGAIVVRNSEGLRSLGNQSSAKGEFANQTCFVDAASASDVQFGILSTQDIFGIALMSDGGAERLVSNDGCKVANRLGKWLDDMAEQRFVIDQIALAFHEPAMWERTSLDDRSIVLAARSSNFEHREVFEKCLA